MDASNANAAWRNGHGRNEPLTEDSAAIEYAKRYNQMLRYCHSRGCWFRWDGSIWRRDQKGGVPLRPGTCSRPIAVRRCEGPCGVSEVGFRRWR
jgi:hypothetical protein